LQKKWIGVLRLTIRIYIKLPNWLTPTPNWSQSVENAEWLNVQHFRRTEWSAVLGEKNDGDFVLPKKLKFPNFRDPIVAKLMKKPKYT